MHIYIYIYLDTCIYTCTGKKKDFTPIVYPKPDGQLTFDLLSNLQRRYEMMCVYVCMSKPDEQLTLTCCLKHDQPAHLHAYIQTYIHAHALSLSFSLSLSHTHTHGSGVNMISQRISSLLHTHTHTHTHTHMAAA
jgi:hypothetical protein